MAIATPYDILEGNYDTFLDYYLSDMRAAGYTFEDAVKEWIVAFGADSQDPLVDWAMESYPEWVMQDD